MSSALNGSGYDVIEASDGKEVLAMVEAFFEEIRVKLEAVYDAKMAGRLRQVSIEVQDRVTELLEILKSLRTALQVWV